VFQFLCNMFKLLASVKLLQDPNDTTAIITVRLYLRNRRVCCWCWGFFYLQCLVYRSVVGLRVSFGAPLTGLNFPAVLLLLTVPRRRPSVFLRWMSLLFHTVLLTLLFVSLVFSSTASISLFATSFISLIYPLPWDSCPLTLCPLTLWACYSIIY
jgi:hypothetical protein